MLPVGVEVGAEVIALAQRVEVAGLQRRSQALVEGQRGDGGARLAGPRGGLVGRAVVDDEHVGAGQALAHVGDHGGDRVGLVPGGDEDQRPHAAILPRGAAVHCVSKPSGKERPRMRRIGLRLWLVGAFAAVTLLTAGVVYLFGDRPRAVLGAIALGILAGFLIAVGTAHRVTRLSRGGRRACRRLLRHPAGHRRARRDRRPRPRARLDADLAQGEHGRPHRRPQQAAGDLRRSHRRRDRRRRERRRALLQQRRGEAAAAARPATRLDAGAAEPRRGRRLRRPPGAADRRPRLRDDRPRAAQRARRPRRRPRPHRRDAPRARRSGLHLQRRARAAQPAGRHLQRDRGAAGGRQGRPAGARPLPRPPRRGRRADEPADALPAHPGAGRVDRRRGDRGGRRRGRDRRHGRRRRDPVAHRAGDRGRARSRPPRATRLCCAR